MAKMAAPLQIETLPAPAFWGVSLAGCAKMCWYTGTLSIMTGRTPVVGATLVVAQGPSLQRDFFTLSEWWGRSLVHTTEGAKLRRLAGPEFLPQEMTTDQQALRRFQR
jgi:hypothetical protein